MCGCPIKKSRHVVEEVVNTLPSIEDVIQNTNDLGLEIKHITDDIEKIKKSIVITLGEDHLWGLYNNEVKSKTDKNEVFIEHTLVQTRDLIIKKIGEEKYWQMVNTSGISEYNKRYG